VLDPPSVRCLRSPPRQPAWVRPATEAPRLICGGGGGGRTRSIYGRRHGPAKRIFFCDRSFSSLVVRTGSASVADQVVRFHCRPIRLPVAVTYCRVRVSERDRVKREKTCPPGATLITTKQLLRTHQTSLYRSTGRSPVLFEKFEEQLSLLFATLIAIVRDKNKLQSSLLCPRP